MPPTHQIRPARENHELDAVRGLFLAYAQALPIDLGYQGFAAELAGLPGQYAAPGGELLLATDRAGMAIGCVGLRPRAGTGCEMKRLYVRPEARSSGLGRALVQDIVAVAKGRGYREMLLDTLSTMDAALAIYAHAGFVRCASYYQPTPPGTLFLKLALVADGPAPPCP